MKEKLNRNDILVFILAIAGLLIFVLFYGSIYPTASIDLKYTQDEIYKIGEKTVTELGYDLANYKPQITFRRDPTQIKYLQSAFGTGQANQIMRERIPAYYWQIKWQQPSQLELMISERKNEEKLSETISKALLGEFRVLLNTIGEVIGFNTNLENNEKGIQLKESKAKELSQKFLKSKLGEEFVHFKLVDSSVKKQKNRTDYTFRWQRDEPLAGEKITAEVGVFGDRIGKFDLNFIPPSEYTQKKETSTLEVLPPVLIFLAFLAIGLVILVQKLRRDEISLKAGLIFGIIGGLALAFQIALSSYQEGLLEVIIAVVVAPPFLGILLAVIIATGDSLAREVWEEKLLTFDALQKRRILFPQFSHSLLRGLSLGLISLGLSVLLLKFGSRFLKMYFSSDESQVSVIVSGVPFLYVCSSVILISTFGEFLFRLFTLSYLRRKLQSTFWMITIAALVCSFSFIGEGVLKVSPYLFQIFINFFICILFVYFFLKFDLLTVLVGSFTLNLVEEAVPLISFGNNYLLGNGIALFGVLGIFFIVAVIGFFKKVDAKELTRYVPPYVSRMKERERIKRELEIARNVQLSFLPRDIPRIAGLDVATICIPATEVGGDYYDFIELDDHKLGVVIGDVSGKGISAAFYMTLTKGFLKSQAREVLSPREVLIRLNRLFYENVERGPFISMIYGIFDVRNKTFTFARAGHNPIIIRHAFKGTSEVLCPKGIALGLEKGKIFNQMIEERRISINKNDVFVFYTDGFTEARNTNYQEFGDQRLMDMVALYENTTAEDLLHQIESKVKSFARKTPQHDDMTMVVVRIV